MADLDHQALELEEQFGIPTISLNFPDGRAVIALDMRKAQRELHAMDARLAALNDSLKRFNRLSE